MRKYFLLAIPLLALAVLHAPAQSDKNPKYKISFNPDKDVEQLDVGPAGEKGIFVKVKYSITTEAGQAVDELEGDHFLVVEENGKFVQKIPLQRKVNKDLSVMLTIDTSGSMKEFDRMSQARGAAEAFLKKLPASTDCGLLLFDHVTRRELNAMQEEKGPLIKLAPTGNRALLLQKIMATQPRGGTAFIDATLDSVDVLRTVRGRDRAVVLMTDGIDLNSKGAIKDIITEATRDPNNLIRIYTVGIGEPGKKIPVNTVLVLDHSGSMIPPVDDTEKKPKIKALHEATERYLDTVSRHGRVSIIPFSSNVSIPWAFRDKARIPELKKKVAKEFEPGGGLAPQGETAVFDATYEGVCLLEADNSPGKRAIVAMTDGQDNSSRRRVEEVIERAKEAKIPLYLIGFGREGEIDEVTMRDMAKSTGGQFYHAKNTEKLIEIFESISSDLHDDGIDEETLKEIATKTGGKYYPVKNASELKVILEQVTQSIKQEPHVYFKSLNQRADGTLRRVTLSLTDAEGKKEDEQSGGYLKRGLVVAEMNHIIYLVLLVGIGALIALPGLLRRSAA